MIPIFCGVVKNGKLTLTDEGRYSAYLATLQGEVDVVVRRPRKQRTSPQNKFLWGVVYALISEHTGFTLDEVHDAMRLMFLRDEDKSIPTLKSTTSLSVVEMSRYWEQIRQFAAEKLDLQIPDPNEVIA